jgi:hypothetical protein
MKKYLPRVFKFYQPKATGGGFLIFEWTLVITVYRVRTKIFCCDRNGTLSKSYIVTEVIKIKNVHGYKKIEPS